MSKSGQGDKLLSAERHLRILDVLERRDAVGVPELSRLLGVSPASVRRDLAQLERGGALRRTHGGAVSSRVRHLPRTFEEKRSESTEAKQRIARRALELIADGSTIGLDGGTTTQLVADGLGTRRDLTVVTNSVQVLTVLAAHPQVTVVAVGGTLQHPTQATVGTLSGLVLERVRLDKVFLGADGVVPDEGFFTSTDVEAYTKQKMMQAAREVVLVAASEKAGVRAFSRVARMEEVRVWIVDRGCPPAVIARARERGVQVDVV